MFNSKILSLCLVATWMVTQVSAAFAGGCAPGMPCWEDEAPKVRRPAPTKPEVMKPKAAPEVMEKKMMDVEEPEEVSLEEDGSGPSLALSAGVNVLYFDCEDTSVAPGIFADYRPSADLPVNIRLGVEGTEIDAAEQFDFRGGSSFALGSEDSNPDFTFIRIPLSVEYVKDVSEDTKVFVGGGPDLISISGDESDTLVGLHLGARVQKDITDNIGVSLGAGYLFAEGDVGDADEDLDIDSAYTGVHVVANLF